MTPLTVLAGWCAASLVAGAAWSALGLWMHWAEQRPARPLDRRGTVHRPAPLSFPAASNPHTLGHPTWQVYATTPAAAWHAPERSA